MGAVFLLLVASAGNVERLEALHDGLHEQVTANYRARAYDPTLGRFLQRDPIGIWGDGINFGNGYGYVGEDPGNGRDPMGLWKSWDHRSLTTQSLADSMPDGINQECKKYIEDTTIEANLGQDSGVGFDEPWRHFTRKIDGNDENIDLAIMRYVSYLRLLNKIFELNLENVTGECDSSNERKSCDWAMRALGRLTHSWQDYFGHGIRMEPRNHHVWGDGLQGDPDNLNPNIIPSSFGGRFMLGGEHGWLEPTGGYFTFELSERHRLAREFVSQKISPMLLAWYNKCKCCCPPVEQPKQWEPGDPF